MIKLLLILNSLLISTAGLIGMVGYVALEKIPSDFLNTLMKGFELSPMVELMLFSIVLSGLFGIVSVVYQRRVWIVSGVLVHILAIVLTIKVSLDMSMIPKAKLIFTTLVVSESAELFSCAYLAALELMLKS